MGAPDSFLKAAALGDVAGLEAARVLARPLHFQDRAGNTLVHIAAREGQPAAIEFLARNGLLIDRPNSTRKTPLWVALESGKLSAAEALVGLGAKVDARGDGGRTILFNLVDTASPTAIQFLLEHGADLRPKTNYSWERTIICRLLCNPGFQARSEVAELLLQHGADLDEPDEDGETMLHHTAGSEWDGDVRWLVEHRAKLNIRAKACRTPRQRFGEKAVGDPGISSCTRREGMRCSVIPKRFILPEGALSADEIVARSP